MALIFEVGSPLVLQEGEVDLKTSKIQCRIMKFLVLADAAKEI